MPRTPYSSLKRGQVISLVLVICVILGLIVTLFAGQRPQEVREHAASVSVLQIEQDVLDNMEQNGWDNNTLINNGLGGLWVNWRYGTSPLQTNFNGSGQPDGSSIQPPRHDPLTDIRYLHNLWLYKAQNSTDTRYNSELTKYTAIVKYEYASAHDAQRGWLYDEEFTDLYNLSKDTFYQQQMQNLAKAYAKSIDPKVGIYYKTSTTHPNGYYRPEDALETGLALIQAGIQFNNPTWTQLGQTEVNFVYSHAYISQYHTFADQMDQVLTPSGAVNPSEIFYIDNFRNYIIHGNQTNMGSISQIILSLLHTYQVSNNADYLTKAFDLLNPLTQMDNTLRLWDSTNLGYFQSVTYSGTTAQNPGTLSVSQGKKEVGRQMIMLWAFHLANQYGSKYQDMEQAMLNIGLNKAHYSSGHGVLYEMKPDWSTVTVNGNSEDWVTTEAMGAELEALFTSAISPQPSFSPAPITSASPTTSNARIFSITVCPHGLGNCGDKVSSFSGNTNPLHPKRIVTLTIFDTNNNQIGQPQTSTVTYIPSSQNFQGTISIQNLPGGTYNINIKMDNYLPKQLPSITVTQGQKIILPEAYLVAGDINNDSQLDISDYNAFISCYGKKINTSSCFAPPTATSPGADILDDDKQVDGSDYNEMLREFVVQPEQ